MTVAKTTVFEQQVPLETLSPQQRAEILPAHYFNTIANKTDTRVEPSLVFTKANILSIRRYVEHVNALPRDQSTLDRMTDFALLKYDPEKLFKLFLRLRDNVNEWEYLEGETKTLGTQIERFARNTVVNGEKLISQIEGLPVFESRQSTLKDIAEERYQPVKLVEKEREDIVETIDIYLGLLSKDIDNTLRRIDAVRDRAHVFARTISKELRPDVAMSIREMNEAKGPGRVSALHKRANEIDREISNKKEAYHNAVGNAFSGLLILGVGVIFTGGYYGVEAERIRAEKNELIEERNQLFIKADALEPALQKFELLVGGMINIEYDLKEVEEAAKNLRDVWSDIKVFAEGAKEELAEIDSDTQLAAFILRFGNVIRPWGDIGDLSRELSLVFNAALQDPIVGL